MTDRGEKPKTPPTERLVKEIREQIPATGKDCDPFVRPPGHGHMGPAAPASTAEGR